MDGLDVYIDDYSKPDPIAPDVVSKLMQARYIFNPPQTRVNEAGVDGQAGRRCERADDTG